MQMVMIKKHAAPIALHPKCAARAATPSPSSARSTHSGQSNSRISAGLSSQQSLIYQTPQPVWHDARRKAYGNIHYKSFPSYQPHF